jgi:hypothetical protein
MDNFEQFCINITNPEIPDIETDNCECPSELQSSVDVVTGDISRKIQLNILNKVSVPYIEGTFENLDKVGEILEKLEITEIPDTLLNHIAKRTFGEVFNRLSNVNRSIIAVLTIYILIQKFKGGFLS